MMYICRYLHWINSLALVNFLLYVCNVHYTSIPFSPFSLTIFWNDEIYSNMSVYDKLIFCTVHFFPLITIVIKELMRWNRNRKGVYLAGNQLIADEHDIPQRLISDVITFPRRVKSSICWKKNYLWFCQCL